MKKRKIIIWIFSIVVIISGLFFIFRYRIVASYTSSLFDVREPKFQIEPTFDIGWWAHQENLIIDSFSVSIVESRLNLFNSYSILNYNIYGKVSDDANWKPYISKVHVSERFLREYDKKRHPYLDKDTSQIPEALIEITPIVDTKEDKKYKGEIISFRFTNEIKIQSFHWGNNWIRFQCDSLYKDILLAQRK